MYKTKYFESTDINAPTAIYKMNLEGGKKYIGKTGNFDRRMDQHFSGDGAKVTKKFKPINAKVVDEVPGFFSDDVEQEYTEEYIDKYGYENVRGGMYTNSKTLKKKASSATPATATRRAATKPAEAAPRSRSGRKPGLQAADVVPGRTYKLRSAAMVRMRAELDSPQAPGGLLEKGGWLTVGRVKMVNRASSGTGKGVFRLCCADGRGWVSLRAKGGKDLFRARPRMATLQEADVEVGGSYRVRSMAAVRTGPDMLSPKAEVEFLKPVRPPRPLRSRPQA